MLLAFLLAKSWDIGLEVYLIKNFIIKTLLIIGLVMADQIVGGLTGALSSFGQGMGVGMNQVNAQEQKFRQIQQIISFLNNLQSTSNSPIGEREMAMSLFGIKPPSMSIMDLLALQMFPNLGKNQGNKGMIDVYSDSQVKRGQPTYNSSEQSLEEDEEILGFNDQIAKQNEIAEQKILNATVPNRMNSPSEMEQRRNLYQKRDDLYKNAFKQAYGR